MSLYLSQGLDIRRNEEELVRLVRELTNVGHEAGLPLPRLDDYTAGITMSHLGQRYSCVSVLYNILVFGLSGRYIKY